MTLPAALSADAQSLAPGDVVVLFDIDTAPLGGSDVWYLCAGTINGALPAWRGHIYTPFPLEASGFEWAGRGALPKPRLTVGNVAGLLLPAVIQYNDLVGARVTRWKTLVKYLDGQPAADPNSCFIPDIYFIDRKSQQTKGLIEFELAAALDQQGVMLPRRQLIRDNCSETYRRWNGTAFVYGTCPYAGAARFTSKDAPTVDPAADRCSKRLTGCQARFGTANELPFSGFPGISRTR